MLGRGILSDVDANLLMFQKEKRNFVGFPPQVWVALP